MAWRIENRHHELLWQPVSVFCFLRERMSEVNMIAEIAGPVAQQRSMLAPIENAVREFFKAQFQESPRLLTSSYIDGSVHVHGYRPVPPAEIRLLANRNMAGQLRQYHEQLFRTTRQSLTQLLSRSLGRNVSAVECVFDPAQHEFDIIVTMDRDDDRHRAQYDRPMP